MLFFQYFQLKSGKNFINYLRFPIITLMKNITCGIVGDGNVGKTSFLITLTTKKFPDHYIDGVYDTYTIGINYENITINIKVTDILTGEEDYVRLRQYQYSQYDIILVCFSLVSPSSYESIKRKWIKEIRELEPNKTIVLIGMKSDLRDDFPKNSDYEMKPISTQEGQQLKLEINASDYVECSSLRQLNLNGVFESIAKVYLEPKSPNEKKVSKCLIV